MNWKELLCKVSKETGYSEELLEKVYNSYWEYIRKVISSMPLKEELSEEEFKKLRPNINIPSLGKLACSYDRYVGIKKRNKRLKQLQNDKHKKD